MNMEAFFERSGGVASTNQVAALLGVSPCTVRTWAAENAVPVVGSGFVFTEAKFCEIAGELLDEGEEEDGTEGFLLHDDDDEDEERDW